MVKNFQNTNKSPVECLDNGVFMRHLRKNKTLIMMKNIFYCCLIVFVSSCLSSKNGTLTEPHRPQFHFTPKTGWMNDPNGMVYFKGEYHLFYQYYPDSTAWGPMHWGHAVSKNLIRWKDLPIALFPDSLGYIFSGSAVVDAQNTSGFGKENAPPLVAIFTNHDMAGEKSGKTDYETQGIAYSLDKGRTWTKYAQNPVIKNQGSKDFRDPKVAWFEPSKQWIMTLAVADHVEFYTSKDLKSWVKTGEFGANEGSHGGVWECPDLFPLTTENGAEYWVLIVNIGNGSPNSGSGTQYFIGQFDGKTFRNNGKPDDVLWLDYGRDNYAGVTWSNAPNNRRILLGWMSNWRYAQVVPTQKWRSAMTLPRELALKTTENGVRLVQKMVKERKILRGGKMEIGTQNISKNINLKSSTEGKELSLTYDLSATTATDFGVILSNSKGENVKIGYEKMTNRFYIDRTEGGKKDFERGFVGRHYAPRLATDKLLKMTIYTDVASAELFADDGSIVMTDIFFPNENFNQTTLFALNGFANLTAGQVWTLR
jgi:fructan beta-fructosidase